MAEPEAINRIQFSEGIHPVKTTVSAAYREELASVEKARGDYDIEERATRLADSDLNLKKKQVCCAEFLNSHFKVVKLTLP